MRLVIVTGMSGAGKSQALRTMEDMSYFCVDNLPPMLIPTFVELVMQQQSGPKERNIAIGIDIRGGEFFDSIYEALVKLKNIAQYEILFMDAEDEVLIKRYKETRRTHPLAQYGMLPVAIRREREILSHLRESAHHIIDTSHLQIRELRQRLLDLFSEGTGEEKFPISLMSFGYKWGIPLDADLVFDVRFINNPFYIDRLKKHSGKDADVIEYVMSFEETRQFMDQLAQMLQFLIPQYIKEGKNQLVVALGCTGGMHRSVVMTDVLGERITAMGYLAMVEHRDMERESRRM